MGRFISTSRRRRKAASADRGRQRGVSLLEGLVTTAVTAALVVAAPAGLQAWAAAQRLQGMVAQLETELQHARSLAVARNEQVRVGLPVAGGGRCVLLYSGPPAGCTCHADGTAQCVPAATPLRQVEVDPRLTVRLVGQSQHFAFSGVHGTVTPTATVEVGHAGGRSVRLVVNLMGRIRSCAVGAPWGGLPAC